MDLGISSSNKTLSTDRIDCGGSFQVELSLSAEPDITSNPTDIVLVLDRSGSMEGSPLAHLKTGARKFIDIIDEATDSAKDGQIGGGSHIGIVSFADTAAADTQLITSVADLRAAVDGLHAGGLTNHAAAFTEAMALFDPASANAKVIVMFTDGRTTAGPDAAPVAEAAKAAGAVIYCIGLAGNGGLDEAALRQWASDPDSAYVAIAPTEGELEALFEDLAENIAKPGATEIVINETVNPCFEILVIGTPDKGTAVKTGPQSLRWSIDKLGVSGSEGAVLRFSVRHIGPCAGALEVNDEITYADKEGTVVDFPSPEIQVDCGAEVIGEDCPEPVNLQVDGCEDSVVLDAGDVALESLGRIVQVDVTLKNICPHKRVALAVILTELDDKGVEHKRGFKTLTIPAQSFSSCRDILVRCIKFVLPQELDAAGHTQSICDVRRLRVRSIANYVDNDFACCEVR